MKLATREAVAGAAAALVAQGKKPTTEAVRAAIGGGSMRDVGGYLKEWREAQAAAAAQQAAEAAKEQAAARRRKSIYNHLIQRERIKVKAYFAPPPQFIRYLFY